ncbi:hypothetical protein Acr_25g0000190 [Actinidia rufa]|uniref:RING-type domain-containing protein n=1 Tax=Actinidia rufa TaxID=165716 RepID=A0A7J0GXR0_9ERIC|nr:hypothetical protein Acr_25g0000190 [Actinidia rufa]
MWNVPNTSASRTIVIYEEDQYNEQVSMPIDHSQQASSQATGEVDLELQLGLRAYGDSVHRDQTVKYPNLKQDETKTESSRQSKSIPKEGKMTCAICSETMKEESCTRCGHIFCKACIVYAINVYGKCPTCDSKVSTKSIRRIYLPAVDL